MDESINKHVKGDKRGSHDAFQKNYDELVDNSTSDRGTPEKNIPPLDEVNYGDTFSICRALKFSSCISPSASVSTISDMTQKSASTISIEYEHIS